MTAARFRAALKLLGWTQERAAIELGVCSRSRVGEWTRGDREVPTYIMRSLEFRVDDHEAAEGCREVTQGR